MPRPFPCRVFAKALQVFEAFIGVVASLQVFISICLISFYILQVACRAYASI